LPEGRRTLVTIYRIFISLLDIEPPIWRCIELSSQTTLRQFHRILQIVIGWENHHLHEFLVGKQRYGVPDSTYDEPGGVILEGKIHLSDVLTAPGAKILYIYDFGDYWRHEVTLEEVVPREPDAEYPRVFGGARNCPPEDCGGTGGYADLLDILVDPTQEDYQHMRDWAGAKFLAEAFSLKDINLRLRRNRSLAVKSKIAAGSFKGVVPKTPAAR
jgi:hypothetical protein